MYLHSVKREDNQKGMGRDLFVHYEQENESNGQNEGGSSKPLTESADYHIRSMCKKKDSPLKVLNPHVSVTVEGNRFH